MIYDKKKRLRRVKDLYRKQIGVPSLRHAAWKNIGQTLLNTGHLDQESTENLNIPLKLYSN